MIYENLKYILILTSGMFLMGCTTTLKPQSTLSFKHLLSGENRQPAAKSNSKENHDVTSCPDLTGVYSCPNYPSGRTKVSVSQKMENGSMIYTFSPSNSEGEQQFLVNGLFHTPAGSDRTQIYYCRNNELRSVKLFYHDNKLQDILLLSFTKNGSDSLMTKQTFIYNSAEVLLSDDKTPTHFEDYVCEKIQI